ncbi:probable F-box protein At1g44080 [Aegilops tauschii subsp. strangulata]|uniref:probable F-box protein At1g44080 n=1 Tax=Aegilops tauschii subsp. strangulata TaxID=200361 RepID=UPI00098BCB25|nr:uncharacterized protein LOC109786176 [Aegilops tauschii subsp. strangulata]
MASAGDSGIPGTSSVSGQWSGLHSDLLRMVYSRLVAPLDRARFDAVCTAWRAAPRHVLPWLILDPRGTGAETMVVYCPKEGVVLPHLPLPTKAIAHRQVLRRVDPPLILKKIIFSEQPTSSGCIVAAITDKHELAFCRVGCSEAGWTTQGFLGGDGLMDIAFCNAELYGITRYTKQLVKFDLGLNKYGAFVIVRIHWLCALNNYWENPNEHMSYIVDLLGKLVIVIKNYRWWSRHLHNICGPCVTVLELVCTGLRTSPHDYKWVELNSLGDYALFLGLTCSKAVPVPACGSGDVQRNHIYFSHHRCLRLLTRSNSDGCVYDKQVESVTDGVEGIMSTGYYAMGDVCPPMWILPPISN